MDMERPQATADSQISPMIPATRIVRTRKISPKTAEAADNPVRKRSKTNSKNQVHEKPEIDQGNFGEKMGSKRRRIYGKLAELPNMPLDILFEIFSHLMPLDLLRLARTTKDFRKLLMSRSSISLWKDVLQNISGLPECPPWMSEPAWVNLVFYPHCHFCFTRTPNIEWRFRARICGKCSKECLGEFRFQYIFSSTSIESVVPCRLGKQRKKAYLMADLLTLNEEYNALEGDEAREAYVQSRKQKVQDIVSHSTLCESWAKSQNHGRELELRQLREERKAAIIRKLEDLGWSQDIAGIRYPDSLAQHKLVDRPQRLTEKIWSHIKEPILEYMALVRQKRLQRELNALILIRKGVAIEVLRAFKKARIMEGNQIMPEAPDFCDFEPVKEILSRPANVDVIASTFDPILPLLPDIISSWRSRMDGAMAEVVKRFIFVKAQPDPEAYEDPEGPRLYRPKVKLSDEQALQKVKGAATAFVCQKCSPDDDDSYDPWSCYTPPPRQPRKLLFYPHVLTHSCLTRQGTGSLEDYERIHDPSKSLGSYFQERAHWRLAGWLVVDKYASGITEAVIRYIGLDPDTATSDDMDHLDDRFICRSCSKKSRIQAVCDTGDGLEHSLYDWRSLVAHLAYCSHSTAVPDLEKNLLRFKPNQLSGEVKEAEKIHRINTIKEWSCFHCLDTIKEKVPSTLASVKQHIKTSHSIENPVLSEDYLKSFNSPDITSNSFQHALKVHFANGILCVVPEDDTVHEDNFYHEDFDLFYNFDLSYDSDMY